VILDGKRILVTGVISRESIAYAVAEEAQNAGAEVILTSFGRAMRLTERAAGRLPKTPDVLELDVNEPEHLERLASSVSERWDGLDGVLHAIAFAPEDALGGKFMTTPPESALAAFQTSAYSFKALAGALVSLFEGEGSIVGLDFDASVAWPVYDWMGVSKAALEAVSRYLARDLGPKGVRVNLVSAGPLETLAARGIPGFRELVNLWQGQAPLGWDPEDREPVAKAVCWLLSDWAKAITGEIVHIDGGFHAMGAPTASPQSAVGSPQDVSSKSESAETEPEPREQPQDHPGTPNGRSQAASRSA
jgi:enoyl-[acyl-carrier protein] reductase I